MMTSFNGPAVVSVTVMCYCRHYVIVVFYQCRDHITAAGIIEETPFIEVCTYSVFLCFIPRFGI